MYNLTIRTEGWRKLPAFFFLNFFISKKGILSLYRIKLLYNIVDRDNFSFGLLKSPVISFVKSKRVSGEFGRKDSFTICDSIKKYKRKTKT